MRYLLLERLYEGLRVALLAVCAGLLISKGASILAGLHLLSKPRAKLLQTNPRSPQLLGPLQNRDRLGIYLPLLTNVSGLGILTMPRVAML
jgi:hypothetical protein